MDKEKRLSIIIPCYNERDLIMKVVRSVLDCQLPGIEKDIIIVDDGSSDGTQDILRTQAEGLVSRVIYCPVNKGKGSAVRLGAAHAQGQVIIIQDADLEYSASEYYKVIEPVFSGQADACYGSRFAETYRISGAYLSNIIANRFLTFLSNLCTGFKLTDMETCFKAVKTDVFKSLSLKEDRFGIEPEITSELAHKGCRVCEVPISYNPRLKSSGKKIGFKDGIQAILCILRCRRQSAAKKRRDAEQGENGGTL